jgi:RHS repeat-associated protein
MKYLSSIILSLVTLLAVAQEPPPTVPNDKNWVSSIGYDFSGATISKGVNFFNVLGMATQQQSWDVLTQRVWATEVRYDYFNRPVLQTLSAPINSDALFGYRADFILSNNAPVTINQYDSSTTLFNPPTISSDPNTLNLGWYYSTNNTLDKYQDITSYPYSRAVYSNLNPSATIAVLGGNKINNQWLQGYSFTMPMEQSTTPMPQLAGRKVLKTVSRGVDGIEAVVYVDTDGNTLAAARSGNEGNPSLPTKAVSSDITHKGFVDIHIPVGCGGNVTLTGIDASKHSIRIFNLITETILSPSSSPSYTTNNTSVILTPGFYRFEDVNNYYGKNQNVTPVRIRYTVNYYDYSTNEYDDADRLVTSTQPLAGLQSTFQYNTLNQLTSTTSPDEGTANFKYRNDGQIRFSQNSEQLKVNAFSYTNYDNLGRPIESGVYKGTEIYFDGSQGSLVAGIVDNIDGLPINGRTEQNFSVYDIPNPELQNIIGTCRLPSQEYRQTFLSGNVSYTYTQNPFTTKTWYSYDVYGRVKWIVQQIPGLSCIKTIDYTYNPTNGQLVKVDYQRHNPTERFVHKYDYNIAGQLIDSYTSLNNATFTRQAHYIYNESGALVRTELADNLQGIDYVYNLSGQLKAINHPSIIPSLDPGADGTPTSPFAADVFGMAIDYYNGDYTRTGTPKPVTTSTSGVDQYNGNIKATRWNTQIPNANHSAYTYNYNKNNWLTQATFGTANATASIVPNSLNDYQESGITYDANGNIQTLNRKGYTDGSGTNSMDNFKYKYSSTLPNRLLSVKDMQDNTDSNRYSDLKDQDITIPTGEPATEPGEPDPTISLPNYAYNDLGQMIMNAQDKIIYDYNASGLVSKISTITNSDITNELPGANLIDVQEYKTIFYDDYDHFTSDNHGWAQQAGVDINSVADIPFASADYFQSIGTNCEIEAVIYELYSKYLLQINGKTTVAKKFRVTQNGTFKLNFDLVLDNYVESGVSPLQDPILGPGIVDANGNPIEIPNPAYFEPMTITPAVTVNLRRPDGTIVYSNSITGDGSVPGYCDRYFTAHIDTGSFTTGTEEYLTLELQISNNLTDDPSPIAVSNLASKKQITYLDNLKLEVATSTKVAFFYNDRGQRVSKESYEVGGNTRTTYYVRDASGNVMGVYVGVSGPFVKSRPPSLQENTIFGAGRIGVFKRTSGTNPGYALYELTDHLGNVRAVIQKTGAGIFALTNKADYYPFGMPMPNKTTTDGNYRYAFQGQEKDPETGMEAFELRLWDGRLGRWLTVDPYSQYDSPYLGMGNNPLSMIDPDGGFAGEPTDPPKPGTGTSTGNMQGTLPRSRTNPFVWF